MRVRAAAVVLVAALASCTLDDVDLTGKRCPCATGWVCDPITNRCVEELIGIDGGVAHDGGMDARSTDAAAPLDANLRMDAPPGIDAAPGVDAPPGIDAPPGVDAPPAIDAGPDPTACDDALAGAMFCDGFEADDGLAAWTMTTGGGATVSRSTALAFRGDASLLAQTTTNGGYMQLKHSYSPITSGELWMRGYMLVPSGSTITHLDTFFLRSSAPPDYDGAVMSLGTELRPFLYINETGDGYAALTPLARDRWTCFEMHIVISATSGSAELYIDGALAGGGTGIDTLPLEGYSLFAVGVTWSNSTQVPTRLYFDEVAMGRTRLPCD